MGGLSKVPSGSALSPPIHGGIPTHGGAGRMNSGNRGLLPVDSDLTSKMAQRLSQLENLNKSLKLEIKDL